MQGLSGRVHPRLLQLASWLCLPLWFLRAQGLGPALHPVGPPPVLSLGKGLCGGGVPSGPVAPCSSLQTDLGRGDPVLCALGSGFCQPVRRGRWGVCSLQCLEQNRMSAAPRSARGFPAPTQAACAKARIPLSALCSVPPFRCSVQRSSARASPVGERRGQPGLSAPARNNAGAQAHVPFLTLR